MHVSQVNCFQGKGFSVEGKTPIHGPEGQGNVIGPGVASEIENLGNFNLDINSLTDFCFRKDANGPRVYAQEAHTIISQQTDHILVCWTEGHFKKTGGEFLVELCLGVLLPVDHVVNADSSSSTIGLHFE